MKFKMNFCAIITPFLITSAFAAYHKVDEGNVSSEDIKEIEGLEAAPVRARTDLNKVENLSSFIDGKTYVENYKSRYIANNNGGVGSREMNERRVEKSSNQIVKVVYDNDGEMPQGYHDSTYIVSSDFGKIDFQTQELDCSDFKFDLYRNEACPAGMQMADNGNVYDLPWGAQYYNDSYWGSTSALNSWVKIDAPISTMSKVKNGVILDWAMNKSVMAERLDKYMNVTNKKFDVNGGVARWWNYSRSAQASRGWQTIYGPENRDIYYENNFHSDGKLNANRSSTGSTSLTMPYFNLMNYQNGKARGVVSHRTVISPKVKNLKSEANISDRDKRLACLATINPKDPSTYVIAEPEKYLGDNCTMACPERPNKVIQSEKEPCGIIKQDLCSLAKQFLGTDKITLDDRKNNVCETVEVQTYNENNISEEFPHGYTFESYEVAPAFKAGKGFYNFPAPYGKMHACDIYKREAENGTRKTEGECVAKQEDLKAAWNGFIQKYKYIYDEWGYCIICGDGNGRRGRWVLAEEEALIIDSIGNGVNASSLASKGGTVLSSGERGTAYTIKGDDGKIYGVSTVTQLINPVNRQVCYYTTLNVQGTGAGPRAYEIQTDSLSHLDMTAKISKTTSCLDGIIGQ